MNGKVVFSPKQQSDTIRQTEGEMEIGPTGLPLRSQLTPGERAYFDAIGLTEDVIKTIAIELQYGLGSCGHPEITLGMEQPPDQGE